MRILLILLALGMLAPGSAAEAAKVTVNGQSRSNPEQERAYRGVREGNILPLPVIRERIRIPGAQFIGADLIAGGTRYRLRYMRGPNVLWVEVDARTGQVLGGAGF